MKTLLSSAEHHFLTTLETAKENVGPWMIMSFPLSKKFPHENLVKDLKKLAVKLDKMNSTSTDFVTQLEQKTARIEKGYIYRFSDSDVIVLAYVVDDNLRAELKKIFDEMVVVCGITTSYFGYLGKEFHVIQKMADQKLLSSKRFEGYHAMCDLHKISSIPVRRNRREHPCVMVVEDDRFTASYASNILSKEYDLYICATGEDAVKAYIEKAPDIVFLDIHLPGMSGHETLEAIKAVDEKAFVVMLSVDTSKNSIVLASKTGAQNFLKKPFSKERLLNTVKSSPYVKGFPVNPTSIH